jgi:hypothetical protein
MSLRVVRSISSFDAARSSGTRHGWLTYQGVGQYISIRLPSGSSK